MSASTGRSPLAAAVLATLLALAVLSAPPPATASTLEAAREMLRNRIEAAGLPARMSVGDEVVHAAEGLPGVYERRWFWPAWSGESGPLPAAAELLAVLRAANLEGLDGDDYHAARIAALIDGIARRTVTSINPRQLVDLDLLLTDAFLVYGAHLAAGRVDPVTFDPEWIAVRRVASLPDLLQAALDSVGVERTLRGLLPPQPGYARLRAAMAGLRAVEAAGGWPAVPDGPRLEPGDRDDSVPALRRRLAASRDLPDGPAPADSTLYDPALADGVRAFQRRHGLLADGRVGDKTRTELARGAGERARQAAINLERWRWLPQDLGERHVRVNVADQSLAAYERGASVLEMRVIVGRDYRRTPVFSDRMTYLVLNPYWQVPPMIAAKDLLPLQKQDSSYFATMGFRLYDGWGTDAAEIDPAGVDWKNIRGRDFRWRLRQDPGPRNALGQVKFMFPNPFDVYLHDTPARALFAKPVRAFSSGCIRLEKPLELAEFALAGEARWTRQAIDEALATGKERTVRLPAPLPIHLEYWTAWVDADGTLQFRDDLYGRDRRLIDALAAPPPDRAAPVDRGEGL